MQARTKRRLALLAGLVAVAVAATVTLAGGSNATPGTIPLHGKMRNIIQHFGCSDAPVTGVCSTFDAIGDIRGDGFVVVDDDPDFSRNGYSPAHTIIHTDKGDLHCNEGALFDFVGVAGIDPFVDLCVINGTGTGIYEGASGYIQEVGTFDTTRRPPVGELDYYGVLVLAGS